MNGHENPFVTLHRRQMRRHWRHWVVVLAIAITGGAVLGHLTDDLPTLTWWLVIAATLVSLLSGPVAISLTLRGMRHLEHSGIIADVMRTPLPPRLLARGMADRPIRTLRATGTVIVSGGAAAILVSEGVSLSGESLHWAGLFAMFLGYLWAQAWCVTTLAVHHAVTERDLLNATASTFFTLIYLPGFLTVVFLLYLVTEIGATTGAPESLWGFIALMSVWQIPKLAIVHDKTRLGWVKLQDWHLGEGLRWTR